VNLGYQIPIPAKRNIRDWEALRGRYLVEQRVRRAKAAQDRQRQRRGLEQEIERIESRPSNAGRSKAVRQLKKKLRDFAR
jgi:hypothetical protein